MDPDKGRAKQGSAHQTLEIGDIYQTNILLWNCLCPYALHLQLCNIKLHVHTWIKFKFIFFFWRYNCNI